MERAGHIRVAVTDDMDINGTMAMSKVTADADRNKMPHGSTVSFHNIHYKVQLKRGFFGKTSPKEILTDLKLVVSLYFDRSLHVNYSAFIHTYDDEGIKC